MEILLRNLRYAIRALVRTPGFTITIVLTLAVGIGANSAVFSAINAILLEPLPFPNADRLMSVSQVEEGRTVANVGPVRLEEWNELNSTFEALTGYYTENVSDTSAELPERLRQASVAPRFLDVGGIAPALGRGFTPAEHQEGAAPVAMISARYWQRRFESDATTLDTTVRVGTQSCLWVGVMPADFAFPDRDVDVWVPTVSSPSVLDRTNAWYTAFGRLRPGVTLGQAQADLSLVQAQLADQCPDTDGELRAQAVPFKDTTVGGVRDSLWLLFGAVSVLLLIACTNIAALLLSRATQRRQEISVRFALGASRWSVAAQTLTEAALLSAAGAVLGLLVAAAASAVFRAFAPNFPRIDEIALDGPILLYALIATVTVTLLCGLAPARQNARSSEGGRVAAAGRNHVSTRHSLQWLFVGVQVALSVTLLAGAGLLTRSFHELSRVDPGFEPSELLTFRLSGSYGEDRGRVIERIEVILEELNALPGIDAAATSSPVPGVFNDRSGFEFEASEFELVEGRTDSQTPLLTQTRVVSSSYFQTMQIPLLAGRPCRRQPRGNTPEIAVNQTFVNRYLTGISPIGLSLRSSDGRVSRIVSVVGDARDYGLNRDPVPTAYSCSTAYAYAPLAFLVRTRGEPRSIVNAVRQKIKELEPFRSVYDVVPLDERMGAEYAEERLRTALLALFAGAALLLVCLGIYGTLSYVVSLRRREVGLRVALGALQKNIVSQFLRKALQVVGVACVAGLALSFASTRVLSGMLYDVSPSDPITLSGVVAIVVAVATAAALIPAVRASRLDPMQVLREE